MALAICATPIGNLDDVTLRVLEELRAGPRALRGHAPDAHPARSARHRRTPGELPPSQRGAKTPRVLERLRAGERIALVSDAGLPGVNDPGARLIAARPPRGSR